jgi:hypothetical protein
LKKQYFCSTNFDLDSFVADLALAKAARVPYQKIGSPLGEPII